jgi:hypothetical protein
MQNVKTLMDEVSQPMATQEEDAIGDSFLVPLRTLMDIDTTVEPQQIPSAPPTVAIESYAEKIRIRKPRGSYRRYTAHQIEQLFECVIEQVKTAKDAAILTGINIRTAQHYIKKYNDDEEGRLPVRGRMPGLIFFLYQKQGNSSFEVRRKFCSQCLTQHFNAPA